MPVLEDQNGNAVQFLSQEDKYALVTGLVLHASGQASMEKANFHEALDTFTMGEEAFNLCHPSHLEVCVTCYIRLRDMTKGLALVKDAVCSRIFNR
jgi:hypothetical protein